MSSLKEIRKLLVDYSYNGFISDEKFVLFYDEIALLLASECSSLH